jgi:hypothetical protein
MNRLSLAHLTLLALATGAEASPKPPESLEDEVMRARATLAGEYTSKESLKEALVNLLAWVDQVPSPLEAQHLKEQGANPEDYVVVAGLAAEAGGAVVQSDQGELVVSQFQIVIPLRALKITGVLGADGKPTPPFRGALPFATIRWLVPRKCFKESPQ